MATPSSVFTEIVSTSLREHGRELADNVSDHIAVLRRMNARGKKRTVDGGYEIVSPLEYAENGTYQRYSGYDMLNVSASDVISAAKFDWKQAAIHVTASGLELRQNAGKNRLINLAESRVRNAYNSARNNLSQDVYSDGTASNQINGLQALIADAGTGTVGGIDSSSQTWWQNNVQSAASPIQGGGSITPSASTIQSLMLPLWLRCTRGMDTPDLISMDETYFTFYENSLTDLKRYAGDDESGMGGFITLKYKSADVVFDASGGQHDSGHPSAHGYFINTDYLELVCHEDADWTRAEDKDSVNQDAVVIPVLFQGNMCVTNRALQGVMKA